MKKLKSRKYMIAATSIVLGMSLFVMHSYETTPKDAFIDTPYTSRDSGAPENSPERSEQIGRSDLLKGSAESRNEAYDNTMPEKKELQANLSRHAGKRDISKLNTQDVNVSETKASDVNAGEVQTNTNSEVAAPSTNTRQPDASAADEIPLQKTTAIKATAEATKSSEAANASGAVKAADVSDDLDLLARLIMAEAQGEPYDAKVAVGSVVMNRVKSGAFPDTISQVIYQNIDGHIQFTPVANGWIDKPANADCIKAAKEAMNGTDATNGALFYYDTTTTNSWILEKKVSIQIGNMIYAY